jgi:hypothetical protein
LALLTAALMHARAASNTRSGVSFCEPEKKCEAMSGFTMENKVRFD